MNNRFRFRVFDKEKNNYVDDSEVELILHNDGVLLFGNWHEDIKVVEQDKFIVEQCTGLKDKNGNLIYEGDIIKDQFSRKFKVRWSEEDCMFDGIVIYRDPEYSDRFDFYAGATDEVEIIGNVHEQAEQKD